MVVVIYGAIALQFVVYTLLLRAFRVSPRSFFVGIQEAILTAFVTRSSNATLPVEMRSAERVGVSESIYGFTLPLGAVVNSDGAAIYMGATVVFVANILGLDLSLTQLVGVVITGVLVSLGTAGVPSGGLLMVTIALTQLGLPLEPLALIACIDAVLDMARTVCNVTGDLVVTKMVAQTEPDLPGDAIQPTLD
jgi:Na+/H+-dicarboxylate symporter